MHNYYHDERNELDTMGTRHALYAVKYHSIKTEEKTWQNKNNVWRLL